MISQRATGCQGSPTLLMDAKAKQMMAEGVDLVSFTAGEPDFDTPAAICEAGKRAIDKGQTRYTPASGTPALKKAICEKFKRDNGLEYAPDQVIVGVGAKHVLYTFFQAVLDPGDEVIIPTPYWVSYSEQVKLAGGVPVFADATVDQGFKVTPGRIQAAVTPKSKVLILNSPSNPTGAVYSERELRALAEVAEKAGLLIVSDEIYEKLIYGQKHVSPAGFSLTLYKSTVTVNGVSKSYAMTGWRIGYAAGPKEIIAAMGRIQSHETSNPTSIAQAAALEALNRGDVDVTPMVKAFQARRDLMLGLLAKIPGLKTPKPEGAFYVFPDAGYYVNRTGGSGHKIKDADDLAMLALSDAKVAMVSGVGFGAPTCIRLSYAVSEKMIETGCSRLAKFFKDLA